MRRLRDDNIPLEVCITSNVCTGAVPSLAEHPVRKLYDAGVPITINTDDPALFRTSLHNEYAIARDRFGISEPELTANGVPLRARLSADHLLERFEFLARFGPTSLRRKFTIPAKVLPYLVDAGRRRSRRGGRAACLLL